MKEGVEERLEGSQGSSKQNQERLRKSGKKEQGRSDAKAKHLKTAILMLGLFTLWTVIVCIADVRPAGPNGSEVGLATINMAFHELIGENLGFYYATDVLSLIPLLIMLGFALLGASQLIKRRSLSKVDRDLLALGALYALLLAAWVGFDALAINYRPLLIEGKLEPSYPSSTTLLMLSVILTAATQSKRRIKPAILGTTASNCLVAFAILMVVARTLSGVHWITDIIGGILLSAGLVLAYRGTAFRK